MGHQVSFSPRRDQLQDTKEFSGFRSTRPSLRDRAGAVVLAIDTLDNK